MRKRFKISPRKSKRLFRRTAGAKSNNRAKRIVKRGGWRM